MDVPTKFTSPEGVTWVPRIPPVAYVVVQFIALAFALLAALARTYLRVKKFRRVTLDDSALLLAAAFLCASVGVTYSVANDAYLTTASNLGLVNPGAIPNYIRIIQNFAIMDDVSNVLSWGAIYTVKVSFVLFLKQLVSRVRTLKIYWWVVMAVVVISTPISMFLSFYICSDFSANLAATCGATVVYRQKVFLTVNCALDILTDSLILSVPIALLWKVQISLRKKLGLGTVLCLSAFMIIIAILRVALDPITLSNGATAPDTPWLYFWTNVEAAVAIVMVSLTAFRSMLGQSGKSSNNSRSAGYPGKQQGSGEHQLIAKPVKAARKPSNSDSESEIRKEIVVKQHISTRSISKPIPMDSRTMWQSNIHSSPV